MRPKDAKISVFDRGFLYGDSIYEAGRCYDGVFFALEDHITRLFNSAERIGMDLQMSQRDFLAEVYQVAHESGIQNAYMRLIVTRGEGPISLDPAASGEQLNRIIIIKSLESMLKPEIYKTGMEIITAKVERNSRQSMDPGIKSGNYLNNVMAMGEARKQGAHDAILLNRDGFISEGTTWNFFIIKDGTVITPPDDAHILLGITRKKIKKICEDNNIPLLFKNIKPADVYAADEAFSSGSFKEIIPIVKIDGKKIGQGQPGTTTERLINLYRGEVQEYCRAWLSRLK